MAPFQKGFFFFFWQIKQKNPIQDIGKAPPNEVSPEGPKERGSWNPILQPNKASAAQSPTSVAPSRVGLDTASSKESI